MIDGATSLRNRSLALLTIFFSLLPSVYVFWRAKDIPQFGLIEDDGLYFTSARSLVEHGEYRLLSIPGQPYQTKYPPLYPLLLSLVWRVSPAFPANLQLASLLSGFFWLLYLGAAAVFLADSKLSKVGRWVAWILLATSPILIHYSSDLLADGLFSALILISLLLSERSGTLRMPALGAALAGLLCGATYLTKTSAIPLLLTTPLVFLLRKQYLRAVCFFLAAIPFAAWWTLWSAAHHPALHDPVALYYRDYMGFYRLNMTWNELPALVSLQLIQTLRAIGNSILFDGHEIVMSVAAGFGILGAVRLLAEAKLLHLAGFAAAYLTGLLFWDYPINERYLFPLAPLLIAGLVRETENVFRIVQKTTPSFRHLLIQRVMLASAAAAFLCILVLNGRTTFVRIPRTLSQYRTALYQRGAAYSWITKNIPGDSAFVSYDGANLSLYTGHPSYRNLLLPRDYLTGNQAGMERTITGVAEFARQHRLKYILCSDDDYELNGMLGDRVLREKLFEKNRGLRRIYASPGVRIYQVD